jgi:hypothetical protein
MGAFRFAALVTAVLALAACEGQFGRMAAINATPTMNAGRHWCSIESNSGSRDCVYDTRELCIAAQPWLAAGNCVENPSYQAAAPTVPTAQAAATPSTASRPTNR